VFATLAKNESEGATSVSSENYGGEDPLANYHDANFFDHGNQEASRWRDTLAIESLEELLAWHQNGGKIGILDATNSTGTQNLANILVSRRKLLVDRIKKESNVSCLFIESLCTDGPILEANIEMKLQGYLSVN
jgi:hypothetical protein